jgi:nucleophosmin 1
MAFWGETLKPGQKKPLKIENADVLHLSQACLHEPKPGKTTLQVIVRGTTYSVAVFEKDKREHDCLDLFFDSEQTTFMVTGSSEVHLMGYIEPAGFDEEGEEEDQPPVVPKAGSPKVSPAAKPAASPKASPVAVAKTAPVKAASPKAAAAAKAAADDDDDSEFLEDEEEEEEPPQKGQSPSAPKVAAAAQAAKAASPKVSPKASPKAAAAAAKDDDDDDLDEDEEGEEELDGLLGEEDSEEDADDQIQQKLPQKSAAPAQSPKRKMDAAPASPAKKGKTEEPSADKLAYVKKLMEFIKTNGKTNLGQLGSKVPRPAGVSKMKVVLEENKDKFNVVGDQVTLK